MISAATIYIVSVDMLQGRFKCNLKVSYIRYWLFKACLFILNFIYNHLNCYGASVIICSLSTVQYNLYMYYTHCSFPDICTSNMLTSVYRRRNRGDAILFLLSRFMIRSLTFLICFRRHGCWYVTYDLTWRRKMTKRTNSKCSWHT